MSLCLFAVLIAALLAYLYRQSLTIRFRRPGEVVPYLIKNFDRLSAKDFQMIERMMVRSCHDSLERDLVYAFRISLILPTIRNLKTLADRWNTANFGASGAGLQMAKGSKNFQRSKSFLQERYIQRFRQISELNLMAAKDKKKARDNIEEMAWHFQWDFPGLALARELCQSKSA